MTPALVEGWLATLAEGVLPDDDVTRVEVLTALERLTGAVASAQARIAVEFDRSQRGEQAAREVPARQRGRGVAHQIGLARRVSPFQGRRLLGLALTLDRELPCTAAALRHGHTSQWRAMIIARETAALSRPDRAAVDREVAADPSQLADCGDRELAGRIAGLAARLDPASVVARRRKAEADRRVSLRPAPDTMAQLSALLPVADGVAVQAALTAAADTARSTGDVRSKGQVMADALVERVTAPRPASTAPPTDHSAGTGPTDRADLTDREGHHRSSRRCPTWAEADTDHIRTSRTGPVVGAPVLGGPATNGPRVAGSAAPGGIHSQVGIMINLIMTDRQLFGGADGSAVITDYGPIDAELARELATRDQAWLRRCFTDPDTGILTNTESRARRYPPGLRTLITLRDQICRTPWCDAPVRHADHIRPRVEGGPTDRDNGQGLCEACNHAKQAPGWHTRLTTLSDITATEDRQRQTGLPTGPPPIGAHDTVLITPTGHRYRTRAPAHPAAPQRPKQIHLTNPDSDPITPSRVPVDIHFRDVA